MPQRKPSPRQCANARRVQEAILHEVNLLSNEGIGPHELVAGLGSALADVIGTSWGDPMVAHWFAEQAQMLERWSAGDAN
jgi:hypothetical protein